MTENRFFTLVWRFNALVIALVATILLCILVWELTRDLRRSYLPTQTTEVISALPADPDDTTIPVQQTARFGAPEPAANGIYAIPQYVEETYRNRGISKASGGNRVNYLIVDTANQSTQWLFEGRARLITDVRAVMHTPAGGRRHLIGHLLHVIENDSNGNGQLSNGDTGTLYFVGAEWSTAIRLHDDLDRIVSARDIGPDMFEVLTIGTSTTSLRRYTLPNATRVFDIPLPDQN